MRTTNGETKCLFCRGQATERRSSLDVLGIPPDISEVRCRERDCGVTYHCEGTLLATQPDLSACPETISRVKAANQASIPIALFWSSKGIEVREYPHQETGD